MTYSLRKILMINLFIIYFYLSLLIYFYLFVFIYLFLFIYLASIYSTRINRLRDKNHKNTKKDIYGIY